MNAIISNNITWQVLLIPPDAKFDYPHRLDLCELGGNKNVSKNEKELH